MSGKQTVLVVDHDQNIRNVLARELNATYEVLFAVDGLEAIWVYERHRERIALVVIDLHVPRLNGQAVTEWVHHIHPALPVIIMSNGADKAVKELLENPLISFVRKPFHLSELKKLLRGILDKSFVGAPKATLTAVRA